MNKGQTIGNGYDHLAGLEAIGEKAADPAEQVHPLLKISGKVGQAIDASECFHGVVHLCQEIGKILPLALSQELGEVEQVVGSGVSLPVSNGDDIPHELMHRVVIVVSIAAVHFDGGLCDLERFFCCIMPEDRK